YPRRQGATWTKISSLRAKCSSCPPAYCSQRWVSPGQSNSRRWCRSWASPPAPSGLFAFGCGAPLRPWIATRHLSLHSYSSWRGSSHALLTPGFGGCADENMSPNVAVHRTGARAARKLFHPVVWGAAKSLRGKRLAVLLEWMHSIALVSTNRVRVVEDGR